MAMIPTDTGVTALEMARALLGNLTNVVGASFTGDAGKSGVASADGGADDAVFLAGGEGAAQFLDIDFVPSQDALFLDILLASDGALVPENGQIADLVDIRMNGHTVGDGNTAAAPQAMAFDDELGAALAADGGSSLRLALRAAVLKDQVNSLRLALPGGRNTEVSMMAGGNGNGNGFGIGNQQPHALLDRRRQRQALRGQPPDRIRRAPDRLLRQDPRTPTRREGDPDPALLRRQRPQRSPAIRRPERRGAEQHHQGGLRQSRRDHQPDP